jgi:hypothetical protein
MDPILPAVPPAGTTPKIGSSPIILPTVSQVELMYFLMELSGDVRLAPNLQEYIRIFREKKLW